MTPYHINNNGKSEYEGIYIGDKRIFCFFGNELSKLQRMDEDEFIKFVNFLVKNSNKFGVDRSLRSWDSQELKSLHGKLDELLNKYLYLGKNKYLYLEKNKDKPTPVALSNIQPIPPVKSKTLEKIVQYSTDGQPIKIWDSVVEATLSFGKTRKETSNIRGVANGKWNTAYGYQWKWLKDVK